MATPEQLAAGYAAVQQRRADDAVELRRIRLVLARIADRAMPMDSGWMIRDEDFDELRRIAREAREQMR